MSLCAGVLFVEAIRNPSSSVAIKLSRMFGGFGNRKTVKAKSDVSVLSGRLQQFRIDMDRYPTQEEGLQVLRARPSGAAKWRGPYTTKDIPNDAWGNPYVYHWPGPLGEDSFSLLSYGSDGTPGGEGDAADISADDQ